MEKEGIITINSDGDNHIIHSMFQVLGMKKNIFSVVNAVDSSHYVLFGLKDVKFLQNITNLKEDVFHIGKGVKDLFILSSYVDKMSANDRASIWHAKLGHLSIDKLKVMMLKS